MRWEAHGKQKENLHRVPFMLIPIWITLFGRERETRVESRESRIDRERQRESRRKTFHLSRHIGFWYTERHASLHLIQCCLFIFHFHFRFLNHLDLSIRIWNFKTVWARFTKFVLLTCLYSSEIKTLVDEIEYIFNQHQAREQAWTQSMN